MRATTYLTFCKRCAKATSHYSTRSCVKCSKARSDKRSTMPHPSYPNWSQKRVANLQQRHRIAPDQWEQMWTVQGGRCKCCGRQMTQPASRARDTDACIDHCHDTQFIRGLICHRCNKKVGHLETVPAEVRRYVARYITALAHGEYTEEETLP